METLLRLAEFVQNGGGWAVAILVIVLFLRILLDEDKSALLRARIYKLAFRLTGRIGQEKKYIANDVKARLNLARRKIHHGHALLPRAVDVVWVESGEGAVQDIKEGEFLVRLDPSTHQEKNIAILATAIVKRTTLEGIRHSVEPPLQKAIDLNLVRYLLGQVGNKAVLDWFLSNEYRPQLEADEPTIGRNQQILAIDERGLFTRVLLVELESFAKRVYGMAPRPYMAGEVEGLVEFLHRLATKPFGQEVPLDFHQAFIRVSVIIVAKTDKFLESIEPYIRAMHEKLKREFYSVYVLAFDKEWLGKVAPEAHGRFEKQMEHLKSEFGKTTVAVKDFDVEFSCVDQTGRPRRGRCIRYVGPS